MSGNLPPRSTTPVGTGADTTSSGSTGPDAGTGIGAGTPEPAPASAVRDGRRAVALYLLSTALIVLAGLLGPSVVVLTLTNRHAWLPSYWFAADPNDWFVTSLIYVAILLGGYGVFLAFRALRNGWAPAVNRLVALGVGTIAAITLVPPMASGDVLIYAAYGRILSLGGNPYTTAPADTIRLGYDPVISATERPWQGAKSVYGPIATWIQWLASVAGGDSMQLTVWMLQLSVAISLIVSGLLLLKLVGPDLAKRRRVLMIGLANPLILWTVLAGAHNDAIAVMFAMIALVLFRRHLFWAGVLLGVAGCTKLSIGLVGVAMLWSLRGDRRKMVRFLRRRRPGDGRPVRDRRPAGVPAGQVPDLLHLHRHAAQGRVQPVRPVPARRAGADRDRDRRVARSDRGRHPVVPGVPEVAGAEGSSGGHDAGRDPLHRDLRDRLGADRDVQPALVRRDRLGGARDGRRVAGGQADGGPHHHARDRVRAGP
jgi:hypothetical protein